MSHLNPSEVRKLIGEEAIANLKTLSEYLQSSNLRARFSMRQFSERGPEIEDSQKEMTACGTVGCAAGHGPYAGIPKHPTESWGDYSMRAFLGVPPCRLSYCADDEDSDFDHIWKWLFSSAWSIRDNTPKGAGQRIDYLLAHGLPDNVTEQMWGGVPLSYKVAP